MSAVLHISVQIAQKLSQAWVSADFTTKQRLQYLLFPDGVLYDAKNKAVRTSRVNEVFRCIPQQERVSEEKENGHSVKNDHLSDSVPHIGELSNQYREELQLLFKIKPLLSGIRF